MGNKGCYMITKNNYMALALDDDVPSIMSHGDTVNLLLSEASSMNHPTI